MDRLMVSRGTYYRTPMGNMHSYVEWLALPKWKRETCSRQDYESLHGEIWPQFVTLDEQERDRLAEAGEEAPKRRRGPSRKLIQSS